MFYVAPFAIDGEPMGIGEVLLPSLSLDRIVSFQKLVEDHGGNFRVSLEGSLNHIEVKLTSASGAGLGAFYANGQLATSAMYLRGDEPEVEEQLIHMFLASLRNLRLVQECQSTLLPFENITKIKNRPIHFVVPIPDPRVSETDEELIYEVAAHFAAAFLCSERD
jgi:hypothetical protein